MLPLPTQRKKNVTLKTKHNGFSSNSLVANFPRRPHENGVGKRSAQVTVVRSGTSAAVSYFT